MQKTNQANCIAQRLIFTLIIFQLLIKPCLAQTPKFIIGFPEDNLSNDWRAAQMNEIQNTLKNYPNVKFLQADANGSIAKNLLDIEIMAEQGVQALFLGPRNPESITPIVKELRSKGIFIILLTRKLQTEDYDVYIGPDDFKIAYNAAGFMAEHLNGKGTILMLEGVPSTSTAIRRKQGFISSMENYKGIKLISRTANYSRTEALLVIEKALNEGTKFDAIYAHNDAMAAGARLALKQAGISPETIPTVGIDFLPETRQAIMDGQQLASFTYPTCGKVGVETALKLLKGQKTPRYIEIPSTLVTRKNVNIIKTVY